MKDIIISWSRAFGVKRPRTGGIVAMHARKADDMPGGKEKLGNLQAAFIQVVMRIRYLFASWFMLKPIFARELGAYPSMLRPKGIPKVDYPTLFAIKMFWLFGSISRGTRITRLMLFVLIKLRVMHLLNWMYLALQRRVARIMERSKVNWEEARRIPLPEYNWQSGSPEEFVETFVKRPHPVLLRGFIREDSDLRQHFSFLKIVEKYGEEEVYMTNKDNEIEFCKIKDLLKPGMYLHNSEILPQKFSDTYKAINTQKLEPYMGKKESFTQFYVGSSTSTGTAFHMACTHNMFHMVDGTKRWYFIDPCDQYMVTPLFTWGAPAGVLMALYPDDYDASVLPAFKYCPVYCTDLQPGDVLFNPAWWIHAIRNTSERSVGIATRWYENGRPCGTYLPPEEDVDIHRFATLSLLTGPKSWGFFHGIIRDIIPGFDEFTTQRENYIYELWKKGMSQLEIARGKFTISGWRPIF